MLLHRGSPMRIAPLALIVLLSLGAVSAQARKPLFGGPKTIPVAADGTIPGTVASGVMAQTSYLSGAKKVAVPMIAVGFETTAKAKITHGGRDSITTKSLNLALKIDPAVLQAITDELQAIVERDLVAQGFEILPKESIDSDARWSGISKDGQPGVEIKDNFMSGFGGNGTFSRWFTAGNRPLFGTGATGVASETGPLIHIAREKKISLMFYRFRIQFTDIESNNGIVFNYVKGKNDLHMVSADVTVFTPEHTLGGMAKLNDNITMGSDYVQDLDTHAKGDYTVVANPERFKADCLTLIKAVSAQLTQAVRRAQ
jgi:hypothetical protein